MEVGFEGISSDHCGLSLSNLGFEPKFSYWSGDLGQVTSETEPVLGSYRYATKRDQVSREDRAVGGVPQFTQVCLYKWIHVDPCLVLGAQRGLGTAGHSLSLAQKGL